MSSAPSLLQKLDNAAKQAFQIAVGAAGMAVGENAALTAALAGVGYDQAKNKICGGRAAR